MMHVISTVSGAFCRNKWKNVSGTESRRTRLCLGTRTIANIRSSEKCLSFTDSSFTTMHLCTNMKPSLSNVVIFILIEQNGSYVIRQNNIKRKMLYIHYFFINRKKLKYHLMLIINSTTSSTKLLSCPKSVFLLQTRLLQRCIFIQTWNLICRTLWYLFW